MKWFWSAHDHFTAGMLKEFLAKSIGGTPGPLPYGDLYEAL